MQQAETASPDRSPSRPSRRVPQVRLQIVVDREFYEDLRAAAERCNRSMQGHARHCLEIGLHYSRRTEAFELAVQERAAEARALLRTDGTAYSAQEAGA